MWYDLTLQQLSDLRKEDEADAHFYKLRASLVAGSDEFALDEKITIQNTVKRTEESYNDRCVEGSFTEIYSFAEERHLPFAPTDADAPDNLVEFIREKYPHMKVGEDEQGTLGVRLQDTKKGSYRYKVGIKDALTM